MAKAVKDDLKILIIKHGKRTIIEFFVKKTIINQSERENFFKSRY